MEYQNRIVDHGIIKVKDILFNPWNWRFHPKHQQKVLRGALEELGWIQEVIINKRTGHLVDGHLRVELAARDGIVEIPVTYIDVSDAEEKKILLTLDPIAAMAIEDVKKRDELIAQLEDEDIGLITLMEELEHEARIDRSLEEIDFEELPDYPMWILLTIPVEKMPDATEFIEELRMIEGIQIEEANR